MTRPLGIGLVGFGRIAELAHLDALSGLPAKLVAIAEPEPARRAAARRRAPGAEVVASHEELLDLPAVGAVIVSVPTGLHAEVGAAVLAGGRHLYLEKPLATNLEDGRRLVTGWRSAGVIGMMGFNYRFHALYRSARDRLRAGELGTLVAASSVFTSAARELPDWKRHRATGGGALLDLASHHVDLVRFLFDAEVSRLLATTRSVRSEDDTAVLDLGLENGLLVQSLFSLGTIDEDRFEIYGERGRLTIDRLRSLDVELEPAGLRTGRRRRLGAGLRGLLGSPYLRDVLAAPGREPSYRAALASFVGAVGTGSPASPDLLDGYRALAIVVAAEESARSGRAVEVVGAADADPAG
jgi:myo-inositol 2-dehydrogenase/D-chiro-inositol 1-dehydrogenase